MWLCCFNLWIKIKDASRHIQFQSWIKDYIGIAANNGKFYMVIYNISNIVLSYKFLDSSGIVFLTRWMGKTEIKTCVKWFTFNNIECTTFITINFKYLININKPRNKNVQSFLIILLYIEIFKKLLLFIHIVPPEYNPCFYFFHAFSCRSFSIFCVLISLVVLFLCNQNIILSLGFPFSKNSFFFPFVTYNDHYTYRTHDWSV